MSGRSGAALVAAASGASVAALGGLVVAGWLTVAVALIQVLPGFPPMQYNTALGFMICGAALAGGGAGSARGPLRCWEVWRGPSGLLPCASISCIPISGSIELLVETYMLDRSRRSRTDGHRTVLSL